MATLVENKNASLNESTDPLRKSSNDNSTGPSEETSPSSSPSEEKFEDDKKETTKEEELVLLQDNTFTIKIQVPNLESFDLQVTSMELVQEIHQMIMDKEETCHRTCFSLQSDGVILDNFSELKSIEGIKDGSIIKLVEEPYTVRESRLHVRHINDLIHSIDPIDNYNGVNCSSLTYLNDITNGDICDRKTKEQQPQGDHLPPDYILPNVKDVPIMPLHLNGLKNKTISCLKQLTFSGWNPPPGKRKMKGDLLYLHVITLEDKRYHITSSTRGFYINQNTDDVFDPRPDNSHKTQHSLVDLLNTVSPQFKKNFISVQKQRTAKHPFERIGTPFQVNTWLSPDFEHKCDWFRAEDSNAAKLGHEDHIPGHTRDWNEELQATKELPNKTLPERLIRERAMFKVHSDFVNAATRGATAVVESNIMAINPGEDSKIQMFIWNNMFFSYGFDVKDHYKDFGGDNAAYVAPINDLQGVKAINSYDIEGLHTLGTVVIDYKGYRVTAQSIIPGILDKEQEQSVVHGSTDFGKTCSTNEKYNELLEKVCSHLKIRPHKIKININSEENEIEKKEEIVMFSSIECKGIIGNDGRHYILDLLRMFPPDLNYYTQAKNEADNQFPRTFRHKLCSLRQELVDAFIDSKYIEFVKSASKQIKERNLEIKSKEKEESDESVKPELTDAETEMENTKQLIMELTNNANKIKNSDNNNNTESSPNSNHSIVIEKACEDVGSWKLDEFDIRFNPNLYQPFVSLSDDNKQLDNDKRLLKEASNYITSTQIPQLIKELSDHTIFITDGVSLCEAMHIRGINIRYLGYLAEEIDKKNDSALSYVHSIIMNELISRCVKRVFRSYCQTVNNLHLSSATSHFMNCYLSNFVKTNSNVTATTETPATDNNEIVLSSKKRKKNQRKQNRAAAFQSDQLSNEWAQLTSRNVWSQIGEESLLQYHFNINYDNNIDSLFTKLKLRKLTLLRSFCQKNGVQLLLREYNMETKHKEAFHEDDILNMYPIVKHVPPKATDAYNFFTNGQAKIQQGYLKEGFELISEAYNLLTNVYGALHPEICMCLRLMARLHYVLCDYNEALQTQHKACMMSERLYGVDHSQTITEYSHLALYCFANNQIVASLKLLYRARYLLLINYGEDHPEMSLIDSNLGLILQASGEYDIAVKFLESSLIANKKYFGEKSMKTALSYHLLARLQSCRGDFRTALMNERNTYQIYKALLGDEHERTKESAQVLKHLTEQAVLLQKKINELYKGDKNVKFPPIQIQQPSLHTVLSMLNIINGIIFIQPQDQELEKIRDELLKYEKKTAEAGEIEGKLNAAAIDSKKEAVNSQDDDLQ